MTRHLEDNNRALSDRGVFTISRGSQHRGRGRRRRDPDDGVTGRGECVPYARYGETVESVAAQIERARLRRRSRGSRRDDPRRRHAAGRRAQRRSTARSGISRPSSPACRSPRPLGRRTPHAADRRPTRLASATPEAMAEAAQRTPRAAAPQGEARRRRTTSSGSRAVRAAAPDARLIVDANEGWTRDDYRATSRRACADAGVELIEQPLPAGRRLPAGACRAPVPICADESVPRLADLEHARRPLRRRQHQARQDRRPDRGARAGARGRDGSASGVMVGCMVGTSLAMAPAVLLAQGADFVDLDGPLLLARDREPGLTYRGFAGLSAPPCALGLNAARANAGEADRRDRGHHIESAGAEPLVERTRRKRRPRPSRRRSRRRPRPAPPRCALRGAVSPIIFCKPISSMPVDSACERLHAKKPGHAKPGRLDQGIGDPAQRSRRTPRHAQHGRSR